MTWRAPRIAVAQHHPRAEGARPRELTARGNASNTLDPTAPGDLADWLSPVLRSNQSASARVLVEAPDPEGLAFVVVRNQSRERAGIDVET